MKTTIPSSLALGPITSGLLFLPTEVDTVGACVSGIVATQFMRVTTNFANEEPQYAQGKSASRLARQWDDNPQRADAMQRARQRLAGSLQPQTGTTLATLRLQKGLSQSRLAALIGTKQPYIARVESGEDDLKISTIEKIAEALELSPQEVFAVIAKNRSNKKP